MTYMDKYQARVVGKKIAASVASYEPELVPESIPAPQVVFTDPRPASSGLTGQGVRAFGYNIITAQVGYTSAIGAVLLRDDAHGEVKLTVDRQAGVALGAAFVGPDTGELIHATTITITTGVPVYRLHRVVPAYPTASEIWL